MKSNVRVYLGLLILAGLFWPDTIIVAHPAFYQPALTQPFLSTVLFFWPSLALVMAAFLFYSGITHYQGWQEAGSRKTERPQDSKLLSRQAGRTAAVILALCALLLIKTLANLYWLLIWDRANDSIGFLLFVFPVLAVLFSGLVLFITLPGRAKLAGLSYALFLLAVMFAVFIRTQSVDFRQLTQARAGQVSQAVETYFDRTGTYPQDLRQLTPGYLLSVPGPLIIYGQNWCYQGDVGYYRLGYIYRDHWSSPILTGRIYKTVGQAPDFSSLCDTQIAALRENYPNYPWEYSMSGE